MIDQQRFNAAVMNWISEATGFLHDDVLRTDDARDFIHNACMRCWDAFDRIASPTDHGASPEARASGESVVPQPTPRGDSDRTDKAAPRPSDGTGDTPATHATRGEGSEHRECTEPVAWGVASGKGLLYTTSTSRIDAVDMQSEYEVETEVVPLYRHPQPTLTDAEREALGWAVQHLDIFGWVSATLRALLKRLGGG